MTREEGDSSGGHSPRTYTHDTHATQSNRKSNLGAWRRFLKGKPQMGGVEAARRNIVPMIYEAIERLDDGTQRQ